MCCSGAVGPKETPPELVRTNLARSILGFVETKYEQYLTMGIADFKGDKPLVPNWTFHTGGFKQPAFASGKAWLQRQARAIKRKMHMVGGLGDLLGIDVSMNVCLNVDGAECTPFDPVDSGALMLQSSVLSMCKNAMKPAACPMREFEISAKKKSNGEGRMYYLKAVVETSLMGTTFSGTAEASLDTSDYSVELKLSADDRFRKDDVFNIEGFSLHSPAIEVKVTEVPCDASTAEDDTETACEGASPDGNGCPTSKQDCLKCRKCEWKFPVCRPKPPAVCKGAVDATSCPTSKEDCVACRGCSWQGSHCESTDRGHGRRLLMHEITARSCHLSTPLQKGECCNKSTKTVRRGEQMMSYRWCKHDQAPSPSPQGTRKKNVKKRNTGKKSTRKSNTSKRNSSKRPGRQNEAGHKKEEAKEEEPKEVPTSCGTPATEPICNTRRFDTVITAQADVADLEGIMLQVDVSKEGDAAPVIDGMSMTTTTSYNKVLEAIGALSGVPDLPQLMGGTPGRFDYLEEMGPEKRDEAITALSEGERTAYESAKKADDEHDYELRLEYSSDHEPPTLATEVSPEEGTDQQLDVPQLEFLQDTGSVASGAMAGAMCAFKKAQQKLQALRDRFKLTILQDNEPFVPVPTWVSTLVEAAKEKLFRLFNKIGLSNTAFEVEEGADGTTKTYSVTFDMATSLAIPLFVPGGVDVNMKVKAWKTDKDFGVDMEGRVQFDQLFGIKGVNTEIHQISIARHVEEGDEEDEAAEAADEPADEAELLQVTSDEPQQHIVEAARAVQDALGSHHDIAGMLRAHELLQVEDQATAEEDEPTRDSAPEDGVGESDDACLQETQKLPAHWKAC